MLNFDIDVEASENVNKALRSLLWIEPPLSTWKITDEPLKFEKLIKDFVTSTKSSIKSP